ncbi:hypothetical protein DYB35_003906 [Aphanomyces astaci]|uniref:PI3K/PI4K catalytic domain-containing protein n=1 Tax=Aphanomyces astaci TaxID=112090 RepID=A0A3R6WCN3_APHAT|nr:hypothetical protein DYB35_003906 [Aphanomyces astaci]
MISIWKHRKNVAFTNSLCDELSKLTNTRPILDQVDFYLPQLSHMVLHLEKELPMEAMEQFVMLLSLSSSHFALQFFWIVYGALDEHRPKKNGNPRTFTRCAQLLVILEQCFIYGSPVNKQAKVRVIANPKRHHYFEIHHSFSNTTFKFAALTAQDLQVWVDKVDVASAPPGPPPSSPSKAGPSRAIERMSDRMRSFILEPERRNSDDDDDDAVILTESSPAAADGGASLAECKNAESGKEHEVSKAAPVVDPPSTEQHNDILVAEKVAGGIGTPQDNSSVRNARTSSGSAPVHLTSDEQMRYDFFTAQISFVKAITDICEDLRLVDVSKRKELLPTKLTRLHETLPKYAYLPLCRSTDHFYHVAAVCAQEGYVFKTHERAPVLMHFLTTPNSAHMDVSCALFAHLHAQDEHIDTVKCNAPVLNESTPFIDELLMVRQFYDDLRQEVLVMQLISYLDDVFKREHLKLKLHPYRILSTGASTGLIELCMGGKDSANFKTFTDLCIQAAVAARRHGETLYTLVEVMSFHSKLPCFSGNVTATLQAFRDRLFLNVPEDKVGRVVEGLIGKAFDNFGTAKYDQFQEYSNGIAK